MHLPKDFMDNLGVPGWLLQLEKNKLISHHVYKILFKKEGI
jgi:hypothetical protein